MSGLSRLEQESLASFNEAESFCEIFTYSPRLKRRLAALAAARPDECQQLRSTADGACEWRFPKSWLRVNPTRILSASQRDRLSDAAKERFGHAVNSADGDGGE